MKEIGGYFGLERLINDEYYKNLLALNTGRNALLYLLKAKNIAKIYIPSFLCNSIRDMLKDNNYFFGYYSIDYDFLPIFNYKLRNKEYLLLVNYYGQLTEEKVSYLQGEYKNVILDNTQAFFQKPIEGIDTIYSCRKFFGVPDGAYLSTETKLIGKLETDISKDRMKHILGRFEGTAADYYDDFKNNDYSLKNEQLKYMSELTHNILGAIDYDKARKIRNVNFRYLHRHLKDINRLNLIIPDGPFAYPFYIENGMAIRKRLIKNKIYIPMLWPNVLEDCTKDSLEYDYAANILPLPCDQRYEISDMKIIVNCISGG